MHLKMVTAATIIVALAVCCLSCQHRRPGISIVDWSTDSTALHLIQNKDWHIERAKNNFVFTDSLIERTSAFIFPFSVLNKLNYRQLNFLKRYMEAGAGGVVAIKDTLLHQPDCVWMMNWNNKKTNAEEIQDNGRLFLLSPGANESEFSKALEFVIGENLPGKLSGTKTLPVPDSNRYTRIILADGLDEPMQMALLPGNDVLIVERKGIVKLYKAEQGAIKTISGFNVFSGIEDGLLGVCPDPDFEKNNYLYFYYAVAGDKAINRLSRIKFYNDSIDFSSEKILLEVPMQRKYCCHSAGSITFDSQGLLYLSTGDNTNAEETEGYTPVDERPGRELSDDQATAANTNDLRGKILRIRPALPGSYTIPEGNLFPKDGSKGRPEIFVMGCRNPFRVSVDPIKGYVYWGDVGPDTKIQGEDGLMSYDEINQAKQAGFFGWPYFLGNNQVFPHYDFYTKKTGPGKDPLRPMNLSPYNTGLKELPAAQPAMVWYNKGSSSRFPLVGKGGASAMAGPVFYKNLFANAPFSPDVYYDGKLFVYDWVRRWIRAISFDDNGNYSHMEPFLDHLQFAAPIDMKFAKDGALYILEYGSNGFVKNADAKLSRIEYEKGNRKPVAVIEMDKQYGGVPLTVRFSAKRSLDYDQDLLTYHWQIQETGSKSATLSHTFDKPGEYEIALKVSDEHNNAATTKTKVYVGNTQPIVKITTSANRSFYWDNALFEYQVDVSDAEDKIIDNRDIRFRFGYLPFSRDAALILSDSHKPVELIHVKGKQLLTSQDCYACHAENNDLTGPAYTKIASRYSNRPNMESTLASKIIKGGSGNWGDRPMPAHSDLKHDDAKEIVRYILSTNKKQDGLPAGGILKLDKHIGKGDDGCYLFIADYTDKGGNGISPLHSRDTILLRSPMLQAENFDEGNVAIRSVLTLNLTYISNIWDKRFIRFNGIDMTGIRTLKGRIQTWGVGGNIELRIDKPDGKLIATIPVPGGKDADPQKGWHEVSGPVVPVTGIHSIYFVFTNPNANGDHLFNLDWIRFNK